MFDSIWFWKDRWVRKPTHSGAMEKTYEAIRVRLRQIEEDSTIDFSFSKKSVLDLGCGRGEILSWLASEKGCSVCGVEIGEAPVKYLKEKGYFAVQGDVRSVVLKERFDIVMGCFILQHMMEEEDVFSFYKVALDHLEKDGHLLLVDKFARDKREINAVSRPLSFHRKVWKELRLVEEKIVPLIDGKVDPCKFVVLLKRKLRSSRKLVSEEKNIELSFVCS